MEKDYSLTKEEKAFIERFHKMSREEKDNLIKQQALCENIMDIPYVDMSIDEFCKQYGYVDMDDFFDNISK